MNMNEPYSLPQATEIYAFDVQADGNVVYEKPANPANVTHSDTSQPTHHVARDKQEVLSKELDASFTLKDECCLRCIFQRQRPPHISGRPDRLPFSHAHTTRRLFDAFDLPLSYLDIADGSLATAYAYTTRTKDATVSRFELITHCIAKQGDWAMALSHSVPAGLTSVFWSVDQRIDADRLIDDLLSDSQKAVHPMFIPCIMFAALLRMGLQRRQLIKQRIRQLDEALRRVGNARYKPEPDGISHVAPSLARRKTSALEEVETVDFDQLFELLQSCRKDQASKIGRYDFWQSFHKSIDEGFTYFESVLLSIPDDKAQYEAHDRLKQWAHLTWQRLQSLIARDRDHVDQVEDLSQILHNLVQQREIRLQSAIAKATQRDSESMRRIAILGSVFLPASLVATILNVQEFQFLPGAQLFGAYVAITMPFIAVVVILCIGSPARASLPRILV